ncbi:MAG: cytochrome c3 family protein [Planctomycetes bacterium]|nr:cytochrome c3 family protein [Planctomycetota bacterium]
MAILKLSFGGRSALGRVALAAVLMVAAGCGILSVFGGERPYAFDHAVHQKEGLECATCHATWDSSDRPGMPGIGGCKLCHEEIDAKKPEARRVERLYDGENYKAARATALAAEVVFSHQRHATVQGLECATCHRGIDTNQVVDASLGQRMADCSQCHAERKVANDCATCHREIRADVQPPSHRFQWAKMHGPTVRAQSQATGDDCRLCHTESSCTNCHQAQQPDSHSLFFRTRGHGLLARMDRQSCVACHRSDSCDACHQTTKPISHTGQFGGERSAHCVGCHLPLRDSDCATCHKDAPSHATATPLPVGHFPGMNCRQCHGVGQQLRHADNGDNCTNCHR